MAMRAEDEDDMKFEELFSALDSITASDELKSSTLDAIFSAAEEPAEKVVDLPHKPKLVGGKHSKRNNSRTIRIAGIAACAAIFGIGTFATAMPTSYATVEDGDTTLTIGINSLGMTVSATADSARGDQIIAESNLNNKDYRDAVGTVASAIADQSSTPEKSIKLSVSSDDSSQREAVKKGSSEAIEISGYKKKAPLAKESNEDATATIADDSDDEGSNANESADDGSASFEINTDEQGTKDDTQQSGSDDQVNKYHPLTDNTDETDANSTGSSSDEESADEAPAPEAEDAAE